MSKCKHLISSTDPQTRGSASPDSGRQGRAGERAEGVAVDDEAAGGEQEHGAPGEGQARGRDQSEAKRSSLHLRTG